jgi:hypothetical protein
LQVVTAWRNREVRGRETDRRIVDVHERKSCNRVRGIDRRVTECERHVQLPFATEACEKARVDSGTADDREHASADGGGFNAGESAERATRGLHIDERFLPRGGREPREPWTIVTPELVAEVSGGDDASRVVVDAQHREPSDLHRAPGPIEHVAPLCRVSASCPEAKAVIGRQVRLEDLEPRRDRRTLSREVLSYDVDERSHTALVLRREASGDFATDAVSENRQRYERGHGEGNRHASAERHGLGARGAIP